VSTTRTARRQEDESLGNRRNATIPHQSLRLQYAFTDEEIQLGCGAGMRTDWCDLLPGDCCCWGKLVFKLVSLLN